MAVLTTRKVLPAKKEYGNYAPDKRAIYEFYVDGVLAGRTCAQHTHGGSWRWALISPEGKYLWSAGTLVRLKIETLKHWRAPA